MKNIFIKRMFIIIVIILLMISLAQAKELDLSKVLVLYVKRSEKPIIETLMLTTLTNTLDRKITSSAKIHDAKLLDSNTLVILDEVLWIYDLAKDKKTTIYREEKPLDGRFIVSKNNQYIFYINYYNGVLINTDSKVAIRIFTDIKAAQFSENGEMLYLSKDEEIYVYNIKKDMLDKIYDGYSSYYMKISESGDKIALLDGVILDKGKKRTGMNIMEAIPYEPELWCNNDKCLLYRSGQGSAPISYDLLLVSAIDGKKLRRIRAALFAGYLKPIDMIIYNKSLTEKLDFWHKNSKYELHIMDGNGENDKKIENSLNFNRNPYRYLAFYYNK